ncbi:MAG TPA: asparagine--tRNA ligase [Acidobacteriota bacterium]|nr:asparagine--tRNA ligase [Acidobacteriota bacterium]HOT00602.1 asparagine--tRNA ligase [Acidobacteriota bacterium]HQF87416.1 asparagine--tRNA ligase [Acidobacteriota bacterium]HQG91990.1 asparagine--tRNA ligase [Acidobacteriota bacterium]HQK87701.1 asparagine--tRNA ligase [Acidobacteriota bacterium]
MSAFTIETAARFVDQTVTLKGWLYNRRSSGKILFLIVRDGTGIMQCVMAKNNVAPDVFAQAEAIGLESSLIVTGRVRAEARAAGGHEMDVTGLEVVQAVADYPITKKEHGTAFLMENRHLWLRSRRQHAVIRVRHAIIKACRDYLDANGFTLVDTPIFTPNACEGTTTLFETQYFDDTAYLTQSGQLYNEATAMAFGKVYCFGPTFRAEKSKTRRHLMEFWMIEPEMAWATLDDVMELAENFISHIVAFVLDTRREELKVLERDTSKLENVRTPFPRLAYDDAAKMLEGKGTEFVYGGDFGGTDETLVSEGFDRPVMVHRYPAAVKAFYMETDPADPGKALCVDVLAPEGYGEVIGGGQRLADLDKLRARIREHGLPEAAFQWYLDLRRYGTCPHGGFGMGIERCVAWLCGLEHIRETIAFPRMLYKIYP